MNGDKLFHLLEKKRGFFETILELCQEESEAGAVYREHLEQKHIILSHIEEIDHELKNFQSSFTTLPEKVLHEMEKIKNLMEAILEFERFNIVKRKKILKESELYGEK